MRTVGDAIGRELSYVEMTAETARVALVARGFPDGFATGLLAMQARSVGVPALVTNEVHRVLGRPALTFARWAADNAYVFGGRHEDHGFCGDGGIGRVWWIRRSRPGTR
ncbi:hypothetical protein GCM10018954_009840 [Kutzneria kofuensis]